MQHKNVTASFEDRLEAQKAAHELLEAGMNPQITEQGGLCLVRLIDCTELSYADSVLTRHGGHILNTSAAEEHHAKKKWYEYIPTHPFDKDNENLAP